MTDACRRLVTRKQQPSFLSLRRIKGPNFVLQSMSGRVILVAEREAGVALGYQLFKPCGPSGGTLHFRQHLEGIKFARGNEWRLLHRQNVGRRAAALRRTEHVPDAGLRIFLAGRGLRPQC